MPFVAAEIFLFASNTRNLILLGSAHAQLGSSKRCRTESWLYEGEKGSVRERGI